MDLLCEGFGEVWALQSYSANIFVLADLWVTQTE